MEEKICSRCGKLRKKFSKKYPTICVACIVKQTCLEKYGVSNPTYLSDHNQKVKETCLEKYGVENPAQTKEVKEKISQFKLNLSEKEKQNIEEKKKQTTLKHYGVENPFQSKEIQEKYKETSLKHYGVENPTQSKEIQEKIEQTSLKKYGTRRPTQSLELRKKIAEKWQTFSEEKLSEIKRKQSQKYKYDNLNFDSSPELALYIYCKDHSLNIKREPKSFSFFVENKEYHYFPDFEIEGQLIEIKGSQFLAEDNTWADPYNSENNKWLEAKHQCALSNNVTILYEKDYQKYVNYVKEKYGKQYLQQFKVKKN